MRTNNQDQDRFVMWLSIVLACGAIMFAVATHMSQKTTNKSLRTEIRGVKNTILPAVPLPRTDTLAVFEILGTHYHPVKAQCDADPLVTADNSKISLNKLLKKKIRWVALSRDLLKRWGGPFDYGDTLYVYHRDKNINGMWQVHDAMNYRFRKRVDFLTHKRNFFPDYTQGILIANKPFYNKR